MVHKKITPLWRGTPMLHRSELHKQYTLSIKNAKENVVKGKFIGSTSGIYSALAEVGEA